MKASETTKWLDAIDCAIIEGNLELNDWETDFMDSLRVQIDQDRTLTPKQVNCFEKIYQKATEGDTYR